VLEPVEEHDRGHAKTFRCRAPASWRFAPTTTGIPGRPAREQERLVARYLRVEVIDAASATIWNAASSFAHS